MAKTPANGRNSLKCFGSGPRAYSHGLGGSVTRGDRRQRELWLEARCRRPPAHENRRRDFVICMGIPQFFSQTHENHQ